MIDKHIIKDAIYLEHQNMPTSSPALLSWACQIIQDIRPKSALDVGIGFGKWGFLIKEYSEERAPQDKSNCHLTGIEVFEDYITDVQKSIYDTILIGDASEIDLSCMYFDLAIIADVIEHFEKEEALNYLNHLLQYSKNVILITPIGFAEQDEHYGNKYEIHKSGWDISDFSAPIKVKNYLMAYGMLGVHLTK